MALPKQEQIELLGEILDYILEQLEKSPDKIDRLNIPGLEGQSDLSSAILAILENPSLYINKDTIEAFDESLETKDEEFVDLDADTVKIGKRKFKVKGRGRALFRPLDYINTQLTKMESARKEEKTSWAGKEVKGVTSILWARQNGMDNDTQAMLNENAQGGRDVSSAFRPPSPAITARAQRLCEKYLSQRRKEMTLQEFRDMNPQIRTLNEARVQWEQYNDWRGKYQRATYKNNEEQLKEVLYNRQVFRFLQKLHFYEKSLGYSNMGNILKAGNYRKAANFLDNSAKSEKEEIEKRKKEDLLKKYNQEINRLKKSQDNNERKRLEALRKEVRNLNKSLMPLRLNSFARRMGKFEGMYTSVKSVYGEDLVPDLITGKFFSKQENKKEFLQPSDENTLYERRGVQVRFHAPRKGTNKYQQRYFDGMNKIYYYSPLVWLKTLATGEIFAFLGYQTESRYMKLLSQQIANFDYNRFLEGLKNGDLSYYKSLEKSLSNSQKELIEGFLKKDSQISGLAISFSFISRFTSKVQNFLNEKLFHKLRGTVGVFLLAQFKDAASRGIIRGWMVTGGIFKLLNVFVKESSSRLGIDIDSVFDIFNKAVSKIKARSTPFNFSRFLYEIRLDFKTATFITVGLFILILMGGASYYNTIYATFTHVIPQEVIFCGEDPHEYTQFQRSSGYQNYDRENTYYHQLFDEIARDMGLGDVEFFVVNPGDPLYEPFEKYPGAACYSDPTGVVVCREDVLNRLPQQTLANLFEHELVHQVQFRNGLTARNDRLLMEWGADFLTNNGGNYWFRNSDGEVIRATQTPNDLPGCNQQILEDIAYGSPGSRNTACYQSLSNYITGFR